MVFELVQSITHLLGDELEDESSRYACFWNLDSDEVVRIVLQVSKNQQDDWSVEVRNRSEILLLVELSELHVFR